ncbi:MAG: hypothetical protein ABUT20_38305 [Bacteroidota bacterium]
MKKFAEILRYNPKEILKAFRIGHLQYYYYAAITPNGENFMALILLKKLASHTIINYPIV